MAETALPRSTPPTVNPISRTWRRLSPRIIPVLAVLSAMILTIPFMVITGGRGDIGRGLNIAFTAYSAFIEGALGLAVNNLLTPDDVAAVTKVFASELMERFHESALDILGMEGTLSAQAPGAPMGGRLEQQLRHSLMWVISIGSNEIQRSLIAQRALGLPR